ncbi:hypothetical protein ABT173_17550 [Streptomyces sp. NPDC001795]|uniref:hypothetical protein n=1 Tax=unclassified Streptomyces TaxID=2593676 RepID=UPI0033276FBF
MADEQYKWLNGDAMERLLRGEPLDAVDDDTRAQAARLAEALAALAVTPPPTSEELPGEAAAVAAFRAARSGPDGAGAALGRPARAHFASADAGVVHLGRTVASERRTRWGRPVRFGLAAVMAAGMIGGVAMAAGTGVLPTPFHDHPGPAASVSAAVTPPQPLISPTPGGPETGGSTSPTTGGTTGAPAQSGSSRDEAGDGSAATGRPGDTGNRAEGRSREWWTAVRSSCRDMTGGRELGTERLRALEDAAGGSGRVKKFCKGVLGGEDRGGSGGDQGSGQGRGGKGGSGQGDHGVDQGGNGGDGEGHIGPGPGGFGVAPAPSATPRALAPLLPSRTPSPSPTYSALNSSDSQ